MSPNGYSEGRGRPPTALGAVVRLARCRCLPSYSPAVIRKPNLFIIGAMKAGTSSLCRYLGEHDDVFMSAIKEPMYFSAKETRSQREVDDYLGLFADARDERYVAEGSTGYSKRPFRRGVADRIHAFNPQARFIYVVRDPFDRIVSHYLHQVRKGRESEPLSRAIEKRSGYLPYSHYAFQLRPYVRRFGSDRIYVDTFESLASTPEAFCRRLFRWLDIQHDFVPPSLGERVHATPKRIELPDEGASTVRIWKSLRRYQFIRRAAPDRVKRWVRRSMPKRVAYDARSPEFTEDVAKVRESLRPLLASWASELAELTGRRFDEWPTTSGGESANVPVEKSVQGVWIPVGCVPDADA